MSHGRIRVAVIGTGAIARKAHIPAYLSNKDVELAALVDIDGRKAEKTAKQFGVKQLFTSVDDLFKTLDVDAVSICTPPNTHADIAVKALGRGVHVLCEKPLASNPDEGRKMVEAWYAQEKILMVGFHRRFEPNYKRGRKWILEGKAGHTYLVEDRILQRNPLVSWGKSPWFYTPGVGGVILDLGPHVVDLLNYFFGDFPVSVAARATAHLNSPVEESCVLVLEYPGNRTGVALISWLGAGNIEHTAIHGTAQSLYLSPTLFLELNTVDLPQISLWRNTTERLIRMKFPNVGFLSSSTREANLYQLEIDHFVRHVKENSTCCSNAVDALNVLVACSAAKKAQETHSVANIASLEQL